MLGSPETQWKKAKRIGVTILSICTVIDALHIIGEILTTRNCTSGFDAQRTFIILSIGVLVFIFHGILWRISENLLGTHFGSGGGDVLPTGFHAVVLSVTLTCPLVIAPKLVEFFLSIALVGQNHYKAAIAAIIGGAFSHILMYGVQIFGVHFPGFRAGLMPPVGNVGFLQAVKTEAIYALLYFGCIVLPYRQISQGLDMINIMTTINCSLAFILMMALFIAITYPESLEDKYWVGLRGFTSGILLSVTLCCAMYV